MSAFHEKYVKWESVIRNNLLFYDEYRVYQFLTFSALLPDSNYYVDTNKCFHWHIYFLQKKQTDTLETEIAFHLLI